MTLKRGVATKQAAAIANPVYREKIFKNCFNFLYPFSYHIIIHKYSHLRYDSKNNFA